MNTAVKRAALLFVPIASACTPFIARADTFAQIVNSKIIPLGDTILGLLYAIAFIVFLIGMVRFFFTEGEEGRAKGKQLAFWGIIGFVVLFTVWGFVRVFMNVITDLGT